MSEPEYVGTRDDVLSHADVSRQNQSEQEALRLRIVELQRALEESVKLQSHYASLLNQYDGGLRLGFGSADAWIARLRTLKQTYTQTDLRMNMSEPNQAIKCPDCGEANVYSRDDADGGHDLKCPDCGAVFGEANLPLAERIYSCGRAFLMVGGYALAMEGDVIRDPEFEGRTWTRETIIQAAKAISAKHQEYSS